MDLDAVFDRDRSGPGKDQAVGIDRVGRSGLVPSLDARVPVDDLEGLAPKGRCPGRQRRSSTICRLVSSILTIERHFAGLADQFAMIVGHRHPVADPETKELVTADAVDASVWFACR